MTERKLPPHPDLDHLKRQAKQLLRACLARDVSALAEVRRFFPGANEEALGLHDAQLVLARAYGFDSWPKLKARVDGVTAGSLCETVERGDVEAARAMLRRRAEIVNLESPGRGEQRPLHIAVLRRDLRLVRLLMEHGADAHLGIWPHRDASGARTIAVERGYDELVAVIDEEEKRHRAGHRAKQTDDRDSTSSAARLETLYRAVACGDRSAAVAAIDADPKLARTAASAVARGDVGAVRAAQADGRLTSESLNLLEPFGGLLTIAVMFDRPEMLQLLLDMGLDPDARTRIEGLDEVAYSWGMPLYACAESGRNAMAASLLQRGADPNAQVHTCGSPTYIAYRQKDAAMVALLERHGGTLDAASVGYLRQTAIARKMLDGEIEPHLDRGEFSGKTIAEQLLWSGASGGDPEIVRMVLERIDWPRDDLRWFWMLWRPLPGHHERPLEDRPRYLACFRQVLARMDPNIRAEGTGPTMLHEVVPRDHGEGVGFATALLDAGARLDCRDPLLESTPLGWACRWGRLELVRLFLECGADPIEADAEPWATPEAWARKMGHSEVSAALETALKGRP